MTLDLVQVAEKLPLLIGRAVHERAQGQDRRARALQHLYTAAADPAAFDERILTAQTAWTLAVPRIGRISEGISPPLVPAAYAALAVDGSSIDVDRHLPVDCYVLNFGWVCAHYGAEPDFEAGTAVEVQPVGEELLLRDADDPSRESAVAGAVLDLVRGVRELALLAEKAEELASDETPLLALLDGNLALWNLDKPGLPASIMADLKRRSIEALDRLRRLAETGHVVFGGFVSGTGAANVAHDVRLVECPMEAVVCRACPGKPAGTRPCDGAGVADDAELMRAVLQPWQRSAVFVPHRAYASGTAESWYESEGHEIAFFYLNVEGEIARIELPLWMAEVPERLDLLHALLVRQARSGPSYPMVLQEAHEQAVISTTDRACFAALIEREGELGGIPWLISAKSLSKRVRAI